MSRGSTRDRVEGPGRGRVRGVRRRALGRHQYGHVHSAGTRHGPGNGTLVAAVAAATGQTPLVAGKPEAPLFHAAAKRLAADRPLVVGDRLDTDILGGNNAGFATVAVLTGVDTKHTILAARTAERPDYIINELSDLHRPYPAVDHNDGTYRCGTPTAHGQRGHRQHPAAARTTSTPGGRPAPPGGLPCRTPPRPRAPKLEWLDSVDWSND